ncbi:CDP-glycerol glycerophosphotransferase family protein [Mesotoga sp.]|uniref:CDP-glycerol glycerophosphotransferase family protein n=1 Tax=Mesotoga sp. TaxID=2053577 RepID=UPI001BD58613|nr:CDP-glycerol glycerophosphotransferase family protein [Mesotoga sp.]
MSGISKSIRRAFPEFIKKPLRGILRKKTEISEYPLIRKQPYLHERALERVRKKKIVKVAFFATHSSVWKYDGVYRLMEKDPRFDPIVVVCPVVNYGRENMIFEMQKAYNFFASKGLNVIKAYNEPTDTYLDVRNEINPDIIFYTNPYKGLIKDEYYITNFLDTLTCYVPYTFYVSNMGRAQYDLLFHNLLWKAYYETEIHKHMAAKSSRNKGNNILVAGYPGVDSYIYGLRLEGDVWKNPNTDLKRIIWAPHHTIDMREKLGYSCFLKYCQTILDIAKEEIGKVQIAFKPHPLLKVKLYEKWGKKRTDEYYYSWQNLSNGQLETDSSIDLFNTSDAMILDSASFTAEYLYCGKPSLFTFSDKTVRHRFNEFGNLALDIHYHAYNEDDIFAFISSVVLSGKDTKKNERLNFYNEYLKLPNGKKASLSIYEDICSTIFH